MSIGRRRGGISIILAVSTAVAVIAGGVARALAAPAPAGAQVVNQATITYTDAAGADQETTTNAVVLRVREQYVATLDGDRSREGRPGVETSFFHRLENVGNARDQYCVSVAQLGGDDADLASLRVALDLDDDGVADSDEPIVHIVGGSAPYGLIELDAGAGVGLVVTGVLPAAMGVGDVARVRLTVEAREGGGACVAGSVSDVGANGDATDGTNDDQVAATDYAILSLTKDSEYRANGAGQADDTIFYRLRLRNVGVNPAIDVDLSDTLPAEANALVGAITVESGTFSAGPSESGGEVTGTIDTLGPGAEAVISFEVATVDGLVAGRRIVNQAQAVGNLGGSAANEPPVDSNQTVDIVVDETGVAIADTGVGANPALNDGGDDDGAANDVQRVDDPVAPGVSILFSHVVTNTGVGDDLFNVEVVSSSFPAGTAFRFYRQDARTPMLDNNGDALVDTGLLAPGGAVTIVLRAIAPPGTSGGPFDAQLRATSSKDAGVSDTTTARLTTLSHAAVDIANSASATGFNDGGQVNADPRLAPTTTLGAPQGGTATFDLFIANEGGGADVFNLTAWADVAATTALPAGWSVTFTELGGAPITATPSVAPGATYAFRAVVTVAPDADRIDYPVFFRAVGQTGGGEDIKQDQVSVGQRRASIMPNNSGVVAPCGAVTYDHMLENAGSITETLAARVAAQTALTSVLQLPTAVGGDGGPAAFQTAGSLTAGGPIAVFDRSAGTWGLSTLVAVGGDLGAVLDPGDRTMVRLRVFAACNAAAHIVDQLTVEGRSADGALVMTALDTTTVSANLLSLAKSGALDSACSGVAGGVYTVDQLAAAPGECVRWRLALTNRGAVTVCNVSVADAAPAYTAIETGTVAIPVDPAPGVSSCAVVDGVLSCQIGASIDINADATPESFCMQPGEEAQIEFSVRIE